MSSRPEKNTYWPPLTTTDDGKPITQFFAFLDTTAGLLKSVLTRYIKISDQAWRAFLALVFITIIWLSGDFQNALFVITITLLTILILVDVAIDNWGKIFRTFRREKTFEEIDTSNPTSIIQLLSRYNVTGKDMVRLLEYLTKKNWVTSKMIDTILTQQHLNEYAVDTLITSKLSKRDLLRILTEYRNAASEDALEKMLKEWGTARDVIETCLMYQISSLEIIRTMKNIPRNKYRAIEDCCPIKPFHEHALHKPVQIIVLLLGVGTAYQLFLQHQHETLVNVNVLATSGESVGVLVLSNLLVSILISAVVWGLIYVLAYPALSNIYQKAQKWRFERAMREVVGN